MELYQNLAKKRRLSLADPSSGKMESNLNVDDDDGINDDVSSQI